jgi:hypothetical protein
MHLRQRWSSSRLAQGQGLAGAELAPDWELVVMVMVLGWDSGLARGEAERVPAQVQAPG